MNGTSSIQCFVCAEEVKKGCDEVKVGVKGLNGLKQCSLLRNNGREKELEGLNSLIMHASCKKTYIRRTSIDSAIKNVPSEPSTSTTESAVLRSSQRAFNFNTNCLYCCETIDDSFYLKERKKEPQKRRHVYKVRTVGMKRRILEAVSRRGDQWATEVNVRLADTNDLVASGAIYHQECYLSFFTHVTPATSKKRGRPSSDYVEEAMEEIFSFLENNNDCQFSIEELLSQIYRRTTKCAYREDQAEGKLWGRFDNYRNTKSNSSSLVSWNKR